MAGTQQDSAGPGDALVGFFKEFWSFFSAQQPLSPLSCPLWLLVASTVTDFSGAT